jgi:hypothetical protein
MAVNLWLNAVNLGGCRHFLSVEAFFFSGQPTTTINHRGVRAQSGSAEAGVEVPEFTRVFCNRKIINKRLHYITCKHAPPEKGNSKTSSNSRLPGDGRFLAPREHGPDAGEDAAPVLCRPQHAKAVPGCHWGERRAVSGPQRAITCKEAFVYSTLEGTHDAPRGCPQVRRSRPRTLLWLFDGPVWSCGCPATPAMRSKSWRPTTN